MTNEIGKVLRDAFLTLLEEMGTDYHTAGEKRKALIRENKDDGTTVFKFADEFATSPGNKIKNWATEAEFIIIKARSISSGGSYHHFEVIAQENA